MSYRPYAFGGNVATGDVKLNCSVFRLCRPFAWPVNSSPQGNMFLSTPPRAACSHSASVGNRPPAHSQYAVASVHVTLTTGCVPSAYHSGCRGIWLEVATANARKSSADTSRSSISKPRAKELRTRGLSASSHRSSPGTQPIHDSPPGIAFQTTRLAGAAGVMGATSSPRVVMLLLKTASIWVARSAVNLSGPVPEISLPLTFQPVRP